MKKFIVQFKVYIWKQIPFLKFLVKSISSKHKKFTVVGTRFWNLNLLMISQTIKVLSLIETMNLLANCLLGIEQLIHLEEIHLNAETFHLYNLFKSAKSNSLTK